MKLHLGCGQRYLDGYLNIDFPLSGHTVQQISVADIHADITSISYPKNSVEEIRLHHVFEHFQRPVACGLLACWHSWLQPGGILHLEVPDFKKTALIMLNPLHSLKKKSVAERHLFGSHEASWAVHCEGYTSSMLKNMLASFGFETLGVTCNAWCGTYNLEIIANRHTMSVSKEEYIEIANQFLRNFLLDSSDMEMKLHAVWMDMFYKQLEKGWGQ